MKIKIASCKTLSFLLLKNFAVLQPSFQIYKTTYLATARNKSRKHLVGEPSTSSQNHLIIWFWCNCHCITLLSVIRISKNKHWRNETYSSIWQTWSKLINTRCFYVCLFNLLITIGTWNILKNVWTQNTVAVMVQELGEASYRLHITLQESYSNYYWMGYSTDHKCPIGVCSIILHSFRSW